MRNVAISMLAGALLMAAPLLASVEDEGQGQAVITVLPSHDKETPANLSQQDLKVKINGKDATIRNWIPMRGPNDKLELVVLIDGSARTSLGTQMQDIERFVTGLPANAKVAIAYMQNGAAAMSGPLTTDHAQAVRGLHLPAGSPGTNGSPYFCLSDLAKRWPSNDRGARREVVMITDGVDEYQRRFDPEDPYLLASIRDSVRAGLVVYSIYWHVQGRREGSPGATNAGQNLLMSVTQATGGNSYWEGLGNPVSFQPFFRDLDRRLQNQYELSFNAPLKGKPEVQTLKLKATGISGKVDAPEQVFVNKSM